MNCFNFATSNIIKQALKEDIGKGDITTKLTIPKDIKIAAVIIANEKGVICGLDIAKQVFRAVNKGIKFKPEVSDGRKIKKGKIIARIWGNAQSILIAERVSLNFLSLLSGIATKTRKFVDKLKPYKVKVMDTRKTLPGLRALEKYAVKIGGGYNHRFRLDEMVLIKDNHLKVIGNRLWVIGFKKIKSKIPLKIKKEVEVKTLKEFRNALKIKPDIIMLDNMSINDIKRAVKIRNNLSPKVEASGGITFKDIKKVAATGVDFISLGELTKDIKSLDLSLEVMEGSIR